MLFFLDELLTFLHQIVKIFGFFIDRPPVLYFLRLKTEHVLLQEHIHLSVSGHFYFHFLDLNCNRSVEIVLQFACFLDIGCRAFDLVFDLFETFKMFIGGLNNTLGYNLN